MQPPPEVEKAQPALYAAFDTMMTLTRLAVVIQLAPQYLGVSLSSASFSALAQRYPQFAALRGEGSALETAALIAETKGVFALFAGRGGSEWPDMLRVDLMQSHASLRCFGKRLLAHRIGLGTVRDGAPAMAPSAQGLALLDKWSRDLLNWSR
jgi:hypothetical protein